MATSQVLNICDNLNSQIKSQRWSPKRFCAPIFQPFPSTVPFNLLISNLKAQVNSPQKRTLISQNFYQFMVKINIPQKMLVNSNEWFSAHNLFSNNLNPFLSFSIFINILSLLITFKSFNFNPNLLPQQKKKEENEIKVMISEIFHFDCFLKDFVKDFLGRIYCERFCV